MSAAPAPKSEARPPRNRLVELREELGRSRWTWVLLAVTVVVGAVPRLTNLGGPSMWNDEGTTALLAITAMHRGLPVLPPGGSAWFTLINYEPLYPMLVGVFFSLFGVNQLAARMPAAIIGIALVPTAFFFGRRLRGEHVGLALAITVALSTEYIAWSRQARGYLLFTFLVLLAALLLLDLAQRRDRPLAPRTVALGGVATLLVLSGPGLALLYLPGVILAFLALLIVTRWNRILSFLDLWTQSSGPARDRASPRTRVFVIVALLLALLALVSVLAVVPGALLALLNEAFRAVFGANPYPLVWIPFYGSYLWTYYPLIVVLATVGSSSAILRRRTLDIVLLAFLLGVLLSLSSLLSLVDDAAGGAPVYERYLTPLLVVIFYFAAAGMVELFRVAIHLARTFRWELHPTEDVKKLTTAVAVSLILVVPGAVLPTLLYLNPSPAFSPSGSEVPWQPFSPAPTQPSALYNTPEPNFQRAADYILAHRLPSDVVMAEYPEAPSFYLGHVQYWLFAHPPAGSEIVLPDGQVAYYLHYLTGSVLVSTVPTFDSILMNSSGWVIGYPGQQYAWGPNLTLAVEYLTHAVPAASDNTISLYHWNRSTPAELLETVWENRPDLQAAFGANLSQLSDWAATKGVTIDGLRPVLLPMESALVNLTSPGTRPLAVLIHVFNLRPDLQSMFPEVFFANYTRLIHWAAEVVTGQLHDPAYAALEPYATYYETH